MSAKKQALTENPWDWVLVEANRRVREEMAECLAKDPPPPTDFGMIISLLKDVANEGWETADGVLIPADQALAAVSVLRKAQRNTEED